MDDNSDINFQTFKDPKSDSEEFTDTNSDSEGCIHTKSMDKIPMDLQNDTKYPDYSYIKRVNFLYTKIAENRNERFQCVLCNFETKYLTSIKDHFLRHTNTRDYNCPNCSYCARRNSDLKKHTLYGCCSKKFLATGIYKCELCEYQTSMKPNLIKHRRCHSGERPFSCDKCDYRATQKGALKKHERTHTKTRHTTFECGECNRRYSTKGNLNFHVRHKHSK